MNHFENHMFNPQYFNQEYYSQIRANDYTAEQNERVLKVCHSFSNMLDQVKEMDQDHQWKAFCMCLEEIGRRQGWQGT